MKIQLVLLSFLLMFFVPVKSKANPVLVSSVICTGPQALGCIVGAVLVGGATWVIIHSEEVYIGFDSPTTKSKYIAEMKSNVDHGEFDVIDLGEKEDNEFHDPIGADGESLIDHGSDFSYVNKEGYWGLSYDSLEETSQKSILVAHVSVMTANNNFADFVSTPMASDECVDLMVALVKSGPHSVSFYLNMYPDLQLKREVPYDYLVLFSDEESTVKCINSF